LANIDCFTVRHLNNITYVLFALSGGVGGILIAALDDDSNWSSLGGILGIVLGVLYHLKIARHWWTAMLLKRSVLFLGEFMAPTIFSLLMLLQMRYWSHCYKRGN